MTTRVERPPAVQFVGGFIVTALMFPLIILGAGGNWQWVEGWLFALWFDVMVYAEYERTVWYRLTPYVW